MKPLLRPDAGRAEPRGATLTQEGVNFSVYSETATEVFVSLFDEAGAETGRFALSGREGPVFFGLIEGIGAGTRYGLRAEGPYDPSRGLWFDPDKLLVDPYAKALDKPFVQHPRLAAPRGQSGDTAGLVPKAIVTATGLEKAAPLKFSPRLIYELNPRGYTRLRPDVPARQRGTLGALANKGVAAHFQSLGVDALELMPIAAWIDDLHLPALKLSNAWGYNPITMLAPDPRVMPGGVDDLRKLTDFYRARGVAIILDVVFNHSGEADATGPVVAFRGLDAHTYYRHAADAGGNLRLVNDSGTGNSLDCMHKEVQRLILDAMRYWVEIGGVSGFRFDLATALGRGRSGFSAVAPLITAIKSDPLLAQCLLIAEPWDVGPGGYQLGGFGKPFLEWNDRYRDDVRSFWRGEGGLGALGSRLAGSSDTFQPDGRKPSASVNYLAAHDGFTLRDLVTYAQKHNLANGENNRDGHSHNLSWNCGVEGETEDRQVAERRKRDARALLLTLFVSRGTPMLQQGDEMWRTQEGNNNAYPQDNALTWIDWGGADRELMDYVHQLTHFRAVHPALYADEFLTGRSGGDTRDVIWRHPKQREMHAEDWQDETAPTLGMHLDVNGDELLVWLNRWIHPVQVFCPLPRSGRTWQVGIASAGPVGFGAEPGLVALPARSVVALVPTG